MSNKPQPPHPLPALPTASNQLPTARSQDEFNRLSPDAQARIIQAWSDFWFSPAPAASVPSNARIEISALAIPSPDDTRSTANWKQAPTEEERKSMDSNEWKKY